MWASMHGPRTRERLWMIPVLWQSPASSWPVSLAIVQVHTHHDVRRLGIVSLLKIYAVFGSPQAIISFKGSSPVLRNP